MIRHFLAALLLAGLSASTNGEAPMVNSPASSGGAKLAYNSVHADGPYIALTFDDGPSAANTPRLLDILAKRNIKVTFFVLGECVQANPAILKREAAEGHEIGNHSWDHPAFSKKSDDFVRSQLRRTNEIVASNLGSAPKLMRPPYGAITPRQEKWINSEFGQKVIMWAVDPLDWKRPGPSVVAKRILTETHAGDIILAHDIHAQTVDAIPEVLDGLLAKGFKFVTVSELLAMDKPVAKAPAAGATGPEGAAPKPKVAEPTASPAASPAPTTPVTPAATGSPATAKGALPDSL